ncbi:uncharacterized protein [Gossypium hirsutum]|uniref:Reverse transcriptase Ty1/copia-type domain-containing protein n=1 Tax=Gossypium hirsutum TaxID=3635 RepID=A0ABM2ZJA0_GOSHI|nr:uncharacterized protein LOC121213591 [Gossypium hirsutum]
MPKSIRILIAIAAYNYYEIWQMDVKNVFLNGNLLEDVYMTQLEGFVQPKNSGKACKLQRSIYGSNWKSSKQRTIVDSTTQAGYISASDTAKEAVWIKKFISDLGVVPSITNHVDVYCDNYGAIAQAKEPRSYQ